MSTFCCSDNVLGSGVSGLNSSAKINVDNESLLYNLCMCRVMHTEQLTQQLSGFLDKTTVCFHVFYSFSSTAAHMCSAVNVNGLVTMSPSNRSNRTQATQT